MPAPQSALDFMARHAEHVRRLNVRKRIVFPEGGDPRVAEAARRLARDGIVEPVLLGAAPDGRCPGIEVVDPKDPRLVDKYAEIFLERRRSRGVTQLEAREAARRPMYFAALMVAAGDADGCVGGAATSTGDTVRAAIHCVGCAPHVRVVSSVFVLAVHDRSYGARGLLAFADCAIIVDPSAAELADIAIATAGSVRTLMDVEPAIALLSFSTRGSAKHRAPDKVREALRIVQARAPDLEIDGELQVDAALVPGVGQSKAPGSTVAGRANTLIFPDLASGNIGYKLVERLGDGVAIGPILQGLAKPFNDLSRGCSAADVYNVAIITARQAAAGCSGLSY